MMRVLLLLGLLFVANPAAAQSAIAPVSSLAIEGSHIFCKAACKLYTASLTTEASSGFWMIFNTAFDPADGALSVPPLYCWQWPANYGYGYTWPNGAQFSAGMTMVFSTGANCLTKTESATAFFVVQMQ